MRRMTTNKQLKYVDELSQIAEKAFQIGTYPALIPGNGIFNLNRSLQLWILNESIDFNSHLLSGLCYFEFPDLWEHYGLWGESNDELPWIALICSEFEFPETINTAEALEEYLKTEEGMNDLAGFLDESDWEVDEDYVRNETAVYLYDDINAIYEDGEIKIGMSFACDGGEGEEIENAPDPIGADVLRVENLQTQNTIIKPWYSLSGNFVTDDGYPCMILMTPAIRIGTQYKGYAIYCEEGLLPETIAFVVNFTSNKVYMSGGSEIYLNSANIQLINMLNGEAVKKLVL